MGLTNPGNPMDDHRPHLGSRSPEAVVTPRVGPITWPEPEEPPNPETLQGFKTAVKANELALRHLMMLGRQCCLVMLAATEGYLGMPRSVPPRRKP